MMDNVLQLNKKAPLMWVNVTSQEIPKMRILVMILQACKSKGMNCKKVPLMWVSATIQEVPKQWVLVTIVQAHKPWGMIYDFLMYFGLNNLVAMGFGNDTMMSLGSYTTMGMF